MIDVVLWVLILFPGLMLLEAKQNVRRYILSGKVFFGATHELRLGTKTILFLSIWLVSLPISFAAFVVLIIRWS